MDKYDFKIIEILKKNSRTTFTEIGKQLKLSEGAIRVRIKKLVENGTIRKFTIKTSTKEVKAFIDIKIDVNTKTTEIAKKIKNFKGISNVYEISGEEDIVAIAELSSIAELNDVIENIRKLGIISTKTKLILREED